MQSIPQYIIMALSLNLFTSKMALSVQGKNRSELHEFVGQGLTARPTTDCSITFSSGKFIQSVGLNHLFAVKVHKEKQLP